jgi:phenylacetate-CoA ligase
MEEGKYLDLEIETMDRPALEKLQMERLQWQLKRCYEESPFYQERFRKAGIKPEDIRSLQEMGHIPPVTKQELREDQLAHPPFGRYTVAPRKDWAELHPSTGTTGVPVNTIWSHQDVKNIGSWTARTMWNFGTRPRDIVQNAFSYGLWIAGMSTHYAAQELKCFVLPIGATMTERQIDYLLNPGSTVLLCTPSYALHIAERLAQRGISPRDIPLRRGCFGGEGGTEVPATREKIEKGLGIDAFDYYGLVGVLVMTHLTKEAIPMIRYWTNDLASLTTEKCACGRTHARSIGGILGRADDMIIYKGAKFYPVQVEKVVRSYRELSDEFRIELTTDEKRRMDICTVVVEQMAERGDAEILASRLKKGLKEELLVTPEVSIKPVGSLERTTFKAKRIVDNRKK